MKRIIPLLISLSGVLTDYITTKVGLSLGFHETHPYYHPMLALAIFWGAITLLMMTLPRKKHWNMGIHGLAMWSFLGAVNNVLVILGVFSGLNL